MKKSKHVRVSRVFDSLVNDVRAEAERDLDRFITYAEATEIIALRVKKRQGQ